jgi:hypothetical protein
MYTLPQTDSSVPEPGLLRIRGVPSSAVLVRCPSVRQRPPGVTDSSAASATHRVSAGAAAVPEPEASPSCEDGVAVSAYYIWLYPITRRTQSIVVQAGGFKQGVSLRVQSARPFGSGTDHAPQFGNSSSMKVAAANSLCSMTLCHNCLTLTRACRRPCATGVIR